MSKNFKNIIVSVLTFLFLVGIYLSINTGISHDEFHEHQNWQINLKAIKDFLSTGNYNDLIVYKDRYHGIGFSYISQPIQYIFSDFLLGYLNINNYGSILISKHIAVFSLFFISGIFFYLLISLLIKEKKIAFISLLIYLLYPYLFGHALFNPKDIPFLSIWIICTYLISAIIKDLFLKKNINFKDLIFLSLLTSLLISIRIIGLLIILQYLIFILFYFESKKVPVKEFLKVFKKQIILSIFLICSFTYILNPIFWHNPLEIINSVTLMSKYQQDICTTTLGKCVEALNLPASYYFVWMFFKLPIIILIGFFIFPLVEKKIFQSKFEKIIILSIITTVISILLLFIIFNVAIYDEIRHIMFLIPLIFIFSIYNLYLFNKKIFSYLGMFFVAFFILENVSLKGYSYTWLNSFSKFYNINKDFEVDYWGISNKNLSLKIRDHSTDNNFDKSNCIYGDKYSKVFLENYNFKCFKGYSELDSAKDRPFYVIKNVRNTRRSDPKECDLIMEDGYSYTFKKDKVVTGQLWFCD